MDVPSRFHIGTQRAGSSYVYNLLKSHPSVSMSPSQEVHFYTRKFDQGLDWYSSNFSDGKYAIDTSPKYFHRGDVVPGRIKSVLGDTSPRFFLILRNPIDYLFSHFRMHVRQGVVAGGDASPDALVRHLGADPGYLERALYGRNLEEHWFPHYGPSHFKIVLFEDLVERPGAIMEDVLVFFGIPPHDLTAGPGRENRTLRHPALYRARDVVTRFPLLKRAVTSLPGFGAAYERFSDRSTRPEGEQRAAIAAYLSDDVERLRSIVGARVDRWDDFATR